MHIEMKWVMLLLVALAVFSLLRIISQWRRFGRREAADHDEAFIMQLRKAGVNPFADQDVDFFFTMNDAHGSAEMRTRLANDGFTVLGEHPNPDGSYSLNLQRRMRLVVPEMQALTARCNALAKELGGKYDNWAVAGGKREG
jgi:hypothetical protein